MTTIVEQAKLKMDLAEKQAKEKSQKEYKKQRLQQYEWDKKEHETNMRILEIQNKISVLERKLERMECVR